jgi:hypothetical protein
MAALVKHQIETLRDRIAEKLDWKHYADQAVAASGFFLEEDAVTRKYRRYAAGHRCDFNRYLAMLENSRAGAEEAGTKEKETGLFPPYPSQTSQAAFDFLYHRYRVIAEAEIARIKSRQCADVGADEDECESDGAGEADPRPADAQRSHAAAQDAPKAKTETTARTMNPEPSPEAKPTAAAEPAPTSPAADPPPRPMTRRARKERERRLRAQAKAAKRAAKTAESIR